MARYFTLAQAEALLPEMEDKVRQSVALKSTLRETETEIQGEAERIRISGGALVDQAHIAAVAQKRDAAAVKLREIVTGVQEIGCLIKDLDLGLLDFPTLYRGEEVYLCWKLGEEGIRFWHGVNEGYRGRKPIDQEFLDNHTGDQNQ